MGVKAPTKFERASSLAIKDFLSPEFGPQDVITNTLQYGTDVAISGDYAVVGSPTGFANSPGSAFIYERKQDGSNTWEQIKRLESGNIRFGQAVAIDGDFIVVGEEGFAHVFERNEGGPNNWGKVAKLGASDENRTDTFNDGFGGTVAISGDYILVGASFKLTGISGRQGGAYIFERNGADWGKDCATEFCKETVQLPFPGDRRLFGRAVAIFDNHAVVGAQDDDKGFIAGAAFVFRRLDDGTDNWELVKKLTASDGATLDEFGSAVSMYENRIIVGSRGRRFATPPEGTPGAYIFEQHTGGENNWGEEQKLLVADVDIDDEFGRSVAISKNYALVGAPQDDEKGIDSGAAYLFTYDDGRSWSQITKFTPDPGQDVNDAEKFGFGVSVRLAKDEILIGSPNNSALARGTAFIFPILEAPALVSTSDGEFDDRIQIRWADQSPHEERYVVYRREANGELAEIGSTDRNVEILDDLNLPPGSTFEYCVEAFSATISDLNEQLGRSLLNCDTGWRPPNGTIGGRIAALGGGGTENVDACVLPNPNRGVLFDGVGGFIDVDLTSQLGENLLRPANGLSLEAWINPSTFDDFDGIVDNIFDTGSIESGYGLLQRADNTVAFVLKTSNTGFNYDVCKSPALATGEWHHLAGTYDGANGRLYVNGRLVSTCTITGQIDYDPLNNLKIGSYIDDNESHRFGGRIDEVRIWDHARSAEQINALDSLRLAGNEDGLIGYWPLDEGVRTIAADVSGNGNNGVLIGGAHWSDEGGFPACSTSDIEGNYAVNGLRYGESTEFKVTPMRDGRVFEPGFKTITLTKESPVQNEVGFTDKTAFTVAGFIEYVDDFGNLGGGSCPVSDVSIFVDGEIKSASKADGSYAVAVDPSDLRQADGDPRQIEPQYTNPNNPEDIHTFTFRPALEAARGSIFESSVTENLFGKNFRDDTRHVLSGFYGGSCATPIGKAKIRIYTEDECYNRTIDFDPDHPDFSNSEFNVKLPPQKYLVQIEPQPEDTNPLKADIVEFFTNMGTIEVDLTNGDVERDFIYRAPVKVSIDPPIAKINDINACSAGIVQNDEDGNVLRTLVPNNMFIVEEGEEVPLTINVFEEYDKDDPSMNCPLDKGTVTIFDAISDRAEADSVRQVVDGTVAYTAVGLKPNVFAGARVDGVDRSFQKSITAVVEVEGREPITATSWAIVEGQRERTATFVSATTEEIPLLVLHDPPGDGSYAYIEEGAMYCNRFSNTQLLGAGAGVDVTLNFGFKQEFVLTAFGVGTAIETGAGASLSNRTIAGIDRTTLNDHTGEICVSVSEGFSTSGDIFTAAEDGFTSKDLFVGVALNLIFAKADVLDIEPNSCSLDLSETLAGSLDEAEPFETAYVYTESHIEQTLIPELRSLIDITGDGSISGELEGEQKTIRLSEAVENWKSHLALNEQNIAKALENPVENRSFSGGTEFTFTQTTDTTRVARFESTRIYINSESSAGAVLNLFGFEQDISAAFVIDSEWVTEVEDTETRSTVLGYVLTDDDAGDFFSVDVATDPVYKTPVFGLKSGRSSAPWEPGRGWKTGDPITDALTQPRSKAEISINPPEQFASPDGPAVYTVTVINASQSQESREYVLQTVHTSNPGGAVLTAQGAPIHNGITFELDGDPNNASQEVTLTVERGPTQYTYEGLELKFFPPDEDEKALAASVTFDAIFDAPCSDIALLRPKNPFTYNGLNNTVGPLEVIAHNFVLSTTQPQVGSLGAYYRKEGEADFVAIVEYTFEEPADDWTAEERAMYPNGRYKNSAGDFLSPDATFFAAKWNPAVDGTYELIARTGCAPAPNNPDNQVASAPVFGTIDREGPKLLGTPEPTDGILAFGQDVVATFNEDITCGSIVTAGASANVVVFDEDDTAQPVEAVCDKRKMVIAPDPTTGAGWEQYDGQTLRVELLGDDPNAITDVFGNGIARVPTGVGNSTENPQWEFIVQAGAIAMRPSRMVVGSAPVLVTTLVNGLDSPTPFSLDNLPDYITPSVTEGIIPAYGELPIQLDVDLTAALQADTIRAATDEGPAALYLTCDVPEWTFSPSGYDFNMTVKAQLYDETEALITDPDVRISAYVDDELRGLGRMVDGDAQIWVYSNQFAGEKVDFRVWYPEACKFYPGTRESVTFAHGEDIGLDANGPTTLTASYDTILPGAVALNQGWTWFSTNRSPANPTLNAVFGEVSETEGDLIKSHESFSLFTEVANAWAGSLEMLQPAKGYKIKLSDPRTVRVNGLPVNPTTPIELDNGWNWIGFLPEATIPVEEALATLGASALEVKSQYGFAQYQEVDGRMQWIGSLDNMEPGSGYMIKMKGAGTLVYPEGPIQATLVMTDAEDLAAAPTATQRPATDQKPDLVLTGVSQTSENNTDSTATAKAVSLPAGPDLHFTPEVFNESMSLTIQLDVNGLPLAEEGAILWLSGTTEADDNTLQSIRGKAEARYVEATQSYQFFLMAYGGAAEEALNAHLYLPSEDRTYDLPANFSFVANGSMGSVMDPHQMVFGETLEELPTAFSLDQNYPNPFNPTTTIHYELPEQLHVKIRVYDVLGREVALLVDGEQKAGRYDLTFNANHLASGVYLYKLVAGNFEQVHKMVLLR